MPKLTIDGREIEVEAGVTLIEAARRMGIKTPHFCWHPELSVAANCRMCLVEIEKNPKLQPACQIPAAEGMVVHTENPRVREARRAIMEYLLLNHPVDCPICDQSGECKLQDYYMLYDLKSSRLASEEDKVRKRKHVPFGPHVVYDAERCVMCTRCVRFCAEYVKDPMLCEVHRGDHSEIDVSPDRTLEHGYSLMTAHICPVGALTSRDFRFQCRVWFLKAAETICPGCATGCSACLDHNRGRAFRLRPRVNNAVNRCWLCDDGVLSYRFHNDHRLCSPSLGRGNPQPASWEDALSEAAAALGKTPKAERAAVLSAERTCEENWALIVFAREALGIERFFLAARPDGTADQRLRSADKNPNRAGVRLMLGAEPEPMTALLEAATAGRIRAVIALGAEASAAGVEPSTGLLRLGTVVSIAERTGTLPDAAHVRLPCGSWAQSAGTFVNAKGMAQEFGRAMPLGDGLLDVHEILARLARRLDLSFPYKTAAEVRTAVAGRLPEAGAAGGAP
ncbi:MAG: (2Fe-2S)-binding protein [Acidobacteria bacterium]|nr:(2Fe-2S)-binding protein [Acidobacteriota bacterium]